MSKERNEGSRRYSCEEIIEREKNILVAMDDWAASIAIQTPVGEFLKDPLISLELVN